MNSDLKRYLASLIFTLATSMSAALHDYPCIQTVYPLIAGGNVATDEIAQGLIAISRVSPYQGTITMDSSGYRLEPDVILTSGHSVEARNCLPLLALQWDPLNAEMIYLPVLGSSRSPDYKSETLVSDLALLRLAPPQFQAPSEPKADTSHMDLDGQLLLVGWGKSTCRLDARSIRLRTPPDATRAMPQDSLLLAQVEGAADRVSRGNSGSPVFRESEGGFAFVGIAAYYKNSISGDENQTIGIIPARSIRTFLSQTLREDLSSRAPTSPTCQFSGTITTTQPFILDLNQTHSAGQDPAAHVAHIFAQAPHTGRYKLQILSPETQGWVLTATSITQGKMIDRDDAPSVSFSATASETFILTIEVDSSCIEANRHVTLDWKLVAVDDIANRRPTGDLLGD